MRFSQQVQCLLLFILCPILRAIPLENMMRLELYTQSIYLQPNQNPTPNAWTTQYFNTYKTKTSPFAPPSIFWGFKELSNKQTLSYPIPSYLIVQIMNVVDPGPSGYTVNVTCHYPSNNQLISFSKVDLIVWDRIFHPQLQPPVTVESPPPVLLSSPLFTGTITSGSFPYKTDLEVICSLKFLFVHASQKTSVSANYTCEQYLINLNTKIKIDFDFRVQEGLLQFVYFELIYLLVKQDRKYEISKGFVDSASPAEFSQTSLGLKENQSIFIGVMNCLNTSLGWTFVIDNTSTAASNYCYASFVFINITPLIELRPCFIIQDNQFQEISIICEHIDELTDNGVTLLSNYHALQLIDIKQEREKGTLVFRFSVVSRIGIISLEAKGVLNQSVVSTRHIKIVADTVFLDQFGYSMVEVARMWLEIFYLVFFILLLILKPARAADLFMFLQLAFYASFPLAGSKFTRRISKLSFITFINPANNKYTLSFLYYLFFPLNAALWFQPTNQKMSEKEKKHQMTVMRVLVEWTGAIILINTYNVIVCAVQSVEQKSENMPILVPAGVMMALLVFVFELISRNYHHQQFTTVANSAHTRQRVLNWLDWGDFIAEVYLLPLLFSITQLNSMSLYVCLCITVLRIVICIISMREKERLQNIRVFLQRAFEVLIFAVYIMAQNWMEKSDMRQHIYYNLVQWSILAILAANILITLAIATTTYIQENRNRNKMGVYQNAANDTKIKPQKLAENTKVDSQQIEFGVPFDG